MNSKWKRGALVALWAGATAAAVLAVPAHAATFVVNSTADTVDANQEDGACADSSGACTLRAAVMQANALGGADTIDLTAINDANNPITLSLKGVDETYRRTEGGTYEAVSAHDASEGDLNITDTTTIKGAGAGHTIIQWAAADQLDGSADRIFHIEAVAASVTAEISGLTLKNGLTSPVFDIETGSDGKIWQLKRHGGCLASGVSAATNLLDPSVEHGSGGGGGGGHGGGEEGGEESASVESVTLTGVNVVNCLSGADGGGIYNVALLTVNDSIISGNVATSNGGGIYSSAELNVNRTTIGKMVSSSAFSTGNRAENGGGIFDTGLHTTTIRSSAIVGNSATGGGALAARSTTIDNIENSTVSGNVARDTAGGITTNGRVNLKNVTVADNKVVPTSSSEEGGSAGVGLTSFASGQFTYVNTIIANNALVGATTSVINCGRTGSGSVGTFLASGGHNLEDGDTCNLTAPGDLKNTDPQLQPLALNDGPTETMALLATSPAIDAGDNAVCLNSDQRGGMRPADANLDGTFACDIGAFELFVHTADLHINNFAAPNQVYATDPIEALIEVHNGPTATTTATGVVISTDALPAGFVLTSAEVTTSGGTSPCTSSAGVVTCSVGDLAVDQIATARLLGTTAAPGEITIAAQVSATSPIDPLPDNNTDHVHIQVIGNSDVAVTASGSTSPVPVGTDTEMTFTVNNNGPDAANNVRVAAFPPTGLTYKASSIGQGTCAYSSDDGSLACSVGTLAAGASISGTLTLTAAADGSLTTQFNVDADERDAVIDNDAAGVALSVIRSSDLRIDAQLSRATMDVDVNNSVLVTLGNLGPSEALNVKAVFTLPAGLTFATSGSASGCTTSANTMTCTVPALAANASSTITFSVRSSTAGTYTIGGTVSSDAVDPISTNNSASAQVSVNKRRNGGGCVYSPGAPFDPTFPSILGLGVIGLLMRRLWLRSAAKG